MKLAPSRRDLAEGRFAGLAELNTGRIGDARFMLGCITAVFTLVCALALLPGWLTEGRPATVGAVLICGPTALILLRTRKLSEHSAHIVLACLPLVAGLLTIAAGGGVASGAFAFLNVLVTCYAAMFFTRTRVTAHLLWSLTISATTLTITDPGNRQNGYFTTVLAITMTAAGLLMSRSMQLVWSSATHDTLTGLLNEQGIRAAIQSAPANGGWLIMCDIDRFARVNDALGRDNGDHLLRHMATNLTRLWPHAATARIAADVFAVWIPTHQASAVTAATVAAELSSLHGNYPVGDITVDVTTTAGLNAGTQVEPAVLLRQAATALRAAKHDGRTWYDWTTAMDDNYGDDLQLHAELRAALDCNELVAYYQPQVNRHSHHVVAAEALIRWQHPTRGLLGPGAFLPAAEHSPLITAITDHVLAAATHQGARWAAAGTPLPIAINLSARCLTDDALPTRMAPHLDNAGLPAHLLTVEITETAVVAQPEQARRLLTAIRKLGVRISIDDFGTGHTSLALLTDLPVDELKLDQRFVMAATSQPAATAIVTTVIDLARRLGLTTVAEGVEDQPTSNLLDELGYHTQQGFWHAKPQPATDLTDLLTAQQQTRPATQSAKAPAPA